ncbi:MAG: DUF11 domain-containing protein [Acidobacteriota bacterium]|nr:DUF11 domain-containing protein [Acidobacteriota bacterium]MDH3522489.1 DUF11 domain-containing protein [Acidobacteriota bacterium]
MKSTRVVAMLLAVVGAWLSATALVAQEEAIRDRASARRPPGRLASANPVDEQAGRGLPSLGGVESGDARGLEAPEGTLVSVAIPELPAGKSISVFFDVTVNVPFPAGVTEVANQGVVSGGNFPAVLTDDPDAGGSADPTVTQVLAMPTYTVAQKTVSDAVTGNNDGQAQPGEVLQYEVTLVNGGNGGDTNVNLVDAVPAGTTLDLGSILAILSGGASGFVNASAGNTIDVTVLSMPGAGSQLVVRFQVTVDSPVPAGLELLSNVGQVSSDFAPPFATNAADIVVDAVPVLTLDKDDGGVTVDPETTVVYTLTYANIGDQDASNVTLEDTVPVGSTFDAGASTAGWSCADGDPEGTPCTLLVGTVAGGGGSAAVDFAVEVVAPQDAPPAIDNTATVRDDGAGSGGVPVEATDGDSTPVNDLLPPTVANVDTIKGNGDGVLEECESVAARVNAFRVTFSEAMDPATVVDAANWLVVGSGPDLDIATDLCGPLAGDDVAVPLTGVNYDAPDLTARLDLDLPDSTLPDGPYRLLACAAGGLTDLAGNELDGDGDFDGGDDFVRTFRVDLIDDFANGHFDCGLDPWIPVTTGGSMIVHDPLVDVDGAAISGSAHATNEPGSTDLALGQCVNVAGGSVYDFSGFALLDTPGVSIDVIRACGFFPDPDCAGTTLPAQAFVDTIATDGVWVPFAGGVVVPAAAASTLCQATLRNAAGVPYEAFLDDLSLDLLQSPLIFEDGFESGDTSAWSNTVP